MDPFPLHIQSYIEQKMDKRPNGHFGFRFIFALIGIGEDNWSHVQKDMITSFAFIDLFMFVSMEKIKLLINC